MQTWADLLAAGVDRNKTDKGTTALLRERRGQLRPEQQFTWFGKGHSKDTGSSVRRLHGVRRPFF